MPYWSVKIEDHRFKLHRACNSQWLTSVLSKGKMWEKPESVYLRKQLKLYPGAFLDIGAHIGTHTFAVSDLATELIPVETDSECVRFLRKNAKLNEVSLNESYLGTQASKDTDWSGLKNISAIKIDVDGSDGLDIMEGLKSIIERDKPVVMIEVYVNDMDRAQYEVGPALGMTLGLMVPHKKYANLFFLSR